MEPVYVQILTEEMHNFIIENADLKSKEGVAIFTEIPSTYDCDGKLIVDRYQVVSLIGAYICKHHPYHLMMDDTLKKLFPDVPAEEFMFQHIIRGIPQHIKQVEPLTKSAHVIIEDELLTKCANRS